MHAVIVYLQNTLKLFLYLNSEQRINIIFIIVAIIKTERILIFLICIVTINNTEYILILLFLLSLLL